jgi:predicted phage terminase large subunit-like protein
MDPNRLSKSVLKKARLDLGEFGYSGQYNQNPVPLGGGLFKPERLVVEETVRGSGSMKLVRYWDKAGTKDAGAYTAGVKMGRDENGDLWILDVVRGRWEVAQREAIIRQTAEMDGERVIVGVEQEPGSGGKESAQNTIRNLAGFTVFADRPVGDKAQRADPFATHVNEGLVHLLRGEWNHAYIEEMRFFPLSRYKDQIDASSGAFARLVKRRAVAGGLSAIGRAAKAEKAWHKPGRALAFLREGEEIGADVVSRARERLTDLERAERAARVDKAD